MVELDSEKSCHRGCDELDRGKSKRFELDGTTCRYLVSSVCQFREFSYAMIEL